MGMTSFASPPYDPLRQNMCARPHVYSHYSSTTHVLPEFPISLISLVDDFQLFSDALELVPVPFSRVFE
jgi:hypothetical protein